jgi:hypothetical protein
LLAEPGDRAVEVMQCQAAAGSALMTAWQPVSSQRRPNSNGGLIRVQANPSA